MTVHKKDVLASPLLKKSHAHVPDTSYDRKQINWIDELEEAHCERKGDNRTKQEEVAKPKE